MFVFFFQAEDGIRDDLVTGVQTCALPIFSCAETSPRQSAGVLLTGMGTDGVEGLAALRRAGAMTMVQDEASSVVFGMPRVALERGAAELAQSPIELARTLAKRWRRREEA